MKVKEFIKSWLGPDWPFYAVIGMLILVIWSLALDLRISRNNEREMSRRLYQTVRQGSGK